MYQEPPPTLPPTHSRYLATVTHGAIDPPPAATSRPPILRMALGRNVVSCPSVLALASDVGFHTKTI